MGETPHGVAPIRKIGKKEKRTQDFDEILQIIRGFTSRTQFKYCVNRLGPDRGRESAGKVKNSLTLTAIRQKAHYADINPDSVSG